MKNYSELPLITVICPVYNEEKYIEACIASIVRQDYPKEQIELFFVDGGSNDRTKEIITREQITYSFIQLLDNPKKTPPCAMNIGIAQAKGDYIIRLDGHSAYPDNYFSQLIKYAIALQADNVGGVCSTDVKRHNARSEAIKEVLSNRIGVGNSEFRLDKLSGVKEVDTVPFGCFKRDVFEQFGLYDERLTRNQDIELNKRIKAGGGKIYIVPEIKCTYYARETFSTLTRNNFANGQWNMLTVFYTRTFQSLSLRHFIPLLFVLSLTVPAFAGLLWWPLTTISLSSLLLYFSTITLVSIQASRRKKNNIFCLIWAFFCLHISYGAGSLYGLCSLVAHKR
jgi:glycosyltransferase involved in cell wall biosynthesis